MSFTRSAALGDAIVRRKLPKLAPLRRRVIPTAAHVQKPKATPASVDIANTAAASVTATRGRVSGESAPRSGRNDCRVHGSKPTEASSSGVDRRLELPSRREPRVVGGESALAIDHHDARERAHGERTRGRAPAAVELSVADAD